MFNDSDLNIPGGVYLNHPHDFFWLRRYAIVPNTCFVLMPFDAQFLVVYKTIEKALEGLMKCSRADDLPIGKPILERVMRGISSAELIIADLTGQNPNVFYELGLAHTYTKDVLILAQTIDDVPFDLQGMFCHTYDPKTRQGLDHLDAIVRRAAEAIRVRQVPTMLGTASDRTELIIQQLTRLLSQPARLRQTVIRHQAALSSISNVGYPHSKDSKRRYYGELLEKERVLLIKCLEEGAALQIILAPRTAQVGDQERLRQRFDQLLEFLSREGECMRRCDIALFPYDRPNLLFVGDEILFEGHHTTFKHGFDATMVYTHRDTINKRISLFDSLFESARQYTIERYHSDDSVLDERRMLRNAAIRGIKELRQAMLGRQVGAGQ